ncbi:MAG: Na+ dependent nucleoside transporter domain-containing protein [Candidatus Melainabacteria bacterium GWF2_32_7]|nr:MAG: Na+ dependent nucleoside transporter domain-containing protein [Candidatus Melainabacteria bacterium GWF2_32_7]
MDRFFGIFGIIAILGVAYLLSNNKKAINWRLVISGLLIQISLAVFILKVPLGQKIFAFLGYVVKKLLDYALEGGEFVFGPLVNVPLVEQTFGPGQGYLFVFQLTISVIFIAVLVSISYHIGLMQRIISVVAKLVHKLMGVSGSEALSNAASAFVGQVEAQIMIKPYVSGMTMSELLASMAGSMACIAGGVMAVYISMGVPAEYLLAASIMAAPGALVVSKIVYPETEESETKGEVKLDIKKTSINLIDAAAHGASDGMKISINVVAMLVGFIALIAMLDAFTGFTGRHLAVIGLSLDFIGLDLQHLGIKDIFGTVFSVFAWLMGVPWNEAHSVGALMGTKMVINEFVAYTDLIPLIKESALSPKSIVIASFALCGFANFSSIAIQIGGIGELAPNRKKDLARLGIKALICGTMASYMSATIAGILN